MSGVEVPCSVVEVKGAAQTSNQPNVVGVSRAVYVDGIFYGAARDYKELVRTAKRWRRSEHGNFLVLR